MHLIIFVSVIIMSSLSLSDSYLHYSINNIMRMVLDISSNSNTNSNSKATSATELSCQPITGYKSDLSNGNSSYISPSTIDNDASNSISSSINSRKEYDHYVYPITSIESLRKRYGTRKSIWGEWTPKETRQFYKQGLPRALMIDGALGLSLEARAKLAAEARHALRIYSRERCQLPGRVAARMYDGVRHLQLFGYWSTNGMTWEEVKIKYSKEARQVLGSNATQEAVENHMYCKIVDRACVTNTLFDQLAEQGLTNTQIVLLLKDLLNDKKKKSSEYAYSSDSQTNDEDDSDSSNKSNSVNRSDSDDNSSIDDENKTSSVFDVEKVLTMLASSSSFCTFADIFLPVSTYLSSDALLH